MLLIYAWSSLGLKKPKGILGFYLFKAKPKRQEGPRSTLGRRRLSGIEEGACKFRTTHRRRWHFSSGKVLSWCLLAVKTSATDTTWIQLAFWDELALVAFQHVEKGNKIFVSGRLVSDTAESDDGKQQTCYKVVVQQLNFVERNLSTESSYDNYSNAANADRKLKTRAVNSTKPIEELWQAYFANHVEWWDNRKNKRSPNYPDFKHKDTGEALWLEGRNNPSWVKSQPSILYAKMEAYNNHNPSNRTDFVASDFSLY